LRGRIRRQRDPRERRIVIDAAADGTALGYEIQQASTKRDFIAAVILLEGRAAVVRTELQRLLDEECQA